MTPSFRTLSTDLGALTACTARLALRVDPSSITPDAFYGYGFAADALSARVAAEGEVLERATWLHGSLWNDAWLPDAPRFLPEEARLLLPPALTQSLAAEPTPAIPATHQRAHTPCWVPVEALFAQPRLAQDRARSAMSTGWAYHQSASAAVLAAYRETLERDLAMLFWYGRLAGALRVLTPDAVRAGVPWIASGTPASALAMLKTPIVVPPSYGGGACFALALCARDQPPYLSVGMSVRADAPAALRNAAGECLATRAGQSDTLLRGGPEPTDTDLRAHVHKAASDPSIRERALALVDAVATARQEPAPDYSALAAQVALLRPPMRDGVVAKVWVDGCQPMVPAGVPCGLCARWQTHWGLTPQQWEADRWHPFP